MASEYVTNRDREVAMAVTWRDGALAIADYRRELVQPLEAALFKAAAGFEELHAHMPCPDCPTRDESWVLSAGDECPALEQVRNACRALGEVQRGK